MANPYYDHTTFPATNSAASSLTMRAELDLIEAGFDKLPTLAAHGLEVVRVNAGATALETVAIGGIAQPADATLTSIALLGTAADKMLYTTGVDTWAEAAITTAGRAILDDADAAAQRTTLGASALSVSQTFTGTQIGAVTALSVSANAVAINLATNNNFSLTLQATTGQTLSNPTNPVAGTSGQIAITQNATPSTLAYGSYWYEATTGTAAAVSTTASAQNLLAYYVFDTTHIYYVLHKHGVA